MPAVEKNVGTCYVWIITSLLFVCITAGGILLAIYMSKPDASSSYAIAGIALVCLPWFFWLLTFLYRIVSRRLGFRIAFWGFPADSLPRTSTTTNAAAFTSGGQSNDTGPSATALDSGNVIASTSTAEGGRKVRFGGAVVLGDENEGHDGSESARSHESEAPLRYSMAS